MTHFFPSRALTLASLALLAPFATAQTKSKAPAPTPIPFATHSSSSGTFLGGTDDCATPTAVMGAVTVPFDNTAATTGTDGQGEANCYFFGTSAIDFDTWFCWTSTQTSNVQIQTCNTTATDTKAAVYPGCGCPTPGSSIICNDDACGLQTSVVFAATAATTYTVQLGTFPGTSGGTGMLDFSYTSAPSNNDCATPDVLPGQGMFNFDLASATTGSEGQNEAGCYEFGTTGIDSDIWYTFNSTCNGDATLMTCGLTGTDTKVAAWPGVGCPVDGTSLACNDDTCALQSSIAWPVVAGTSYTLQMGTFPGAAGSTGAFDLTVANCNPEPGIAGCFGDGSGMPCPCSNVSGPGEGCANSSGSGAIMAGAGGSNPDTVVLTVTGLLPNQPGLFFQGDTDLSPGIIFGDGLRCAGNNVLRLSTIIPDAGGCAASDASCGTAAGGFPGSISAHPGQPVMLPGSGITRYYQFWYRDPSGGGACGNSFNLSNNYAITW